MPLVVNEETRRPERATPLEMPERIGLERLVLRKVRAGDAAALFEAYAGDAETCRWLNFKTLSDVEQMTTYLECCVANWKAQRDFVYALVEPEEPADRPFGLINARIQLSTVIFGYAMARSHWSRGYMSLALRTLVNEVLRQPGIWRAQADCAVENPASARVIEKAGMVLEGRLRRHMISPNVSLEPGDGLLYAKTRD